MSNGSRTLLLAAVLSTGVGGGLLPLVAPAQTLTITNGIHTHAALTNTTVTMTGRAELRLTATNSPLVNCLVHLNSPDAWLVLANIQPSVTASGYLGQIRVNGANAVADGNVRVVEYSMGSVVIPHAPVLQPLQVFSGPYCTGVSMALSQYTYYNTPAALGALNRAISSFRLQRGYMATFAQNANGTGISHVFVAQDGDLEVSVMPPGLDNPAFVRVFPWRWTGKKGWAGAKEPLVRPLWHYDWDNVTTSSRDIEYVPMRHNANWNAYANINSKQDSTHVLGFNEPDRPDQANMTVEAAIAQWPNLLASGLRLGAPGVSDSSGPGVGPDWLYEFVAQADARKYRVDFVPVHFYKCDWSATQFYNYLLAIHQQTGRPVWVTEFNNGANWCSTTPTLEQNATKISQFIEMLDNAPFVERYAIYNWVGETRELVTGGTLTPAGVVYRDKQSPVAYAQALPSTGGRSIAQIPFDNGTIDTSGFGNNGLAVGLPAYTNGQSGQAIVLDGTNNCIQLPPNIADSAQFTFAAWVNWDGGANWQRIFDFGNDTTHYLFLTPGSGSGTLRFVIRNGGSEQILETAGLTAGAWRHVAITLAGNTGTLYLDGTPAASSSSFTIAPSHFHPAKNFLAKSQFTADPLFRGRLDQVHIADYAFTGPQVAALMTNTPPQFTTNLISGGAAVQGQAYSNSIAGAAFDPDSAVPVVYSKAHGPAWLAVAADGTLSGTPGFADDGLNEFTVCATDAAGACAWAVLTIELPSILGNGTWSADANGNWSEAGKWSDNFPANGAGNTADFSTLNISADRAVTLDSSRAIGELRFGDTSGGQAWTLTATGGSTLTLETSLAASPSIRVSQNTATVAAPLAGTGGFAKSGSGTLILSAANSLSGDLYIDTSSTTSAEGIVRAANPGALAAVDAISIRNNNSGSSTLQFDGALGDIVTPAQTLLSGRNVNVAAIQNLSGSNTLAGGISINTGGGYYILQSDAGTLNLGGTISSLATGSRTFTFQGAGNFNVAGAIQNGSATVNLTKTGSGTLTLSGANTFSGTNRIVGGTLRLAHAAALQNSVLNLDAADAGMLSFGGLASASIGGLIGQRSLLLNNASNNPVTLTVGGNNQNLTYAGVLLGAGSLVKTNANTLTLSGANLFTGATRVSAGTLVLANIAALQNSTLIVDGGNVSFGALTSATLGGLGGSRNIILTNNSALPVTLTVGGGGHSSAYAGKLSGSGGLIKAGTGTLTLSGVNSYTGATVVNGGTLKLSRDPILKLTFDSVNGSGSGSVVTNDGTGGSAVNGVVVNGATGVSFIPGRVGNALSLAGDGSYVSIADRVTSFDGNTPGTEWTLAMWIRTTQPGAGYAYQGNGGWASGNTAFYLNQGNTTAGTRVGAVRWGGGWLTGNASVNNGTWRFIAITAANGLKVIYVDGNLDAVSTSWTNAGTGNMFWVGGTANSGDGVARMIGQIDEFSVYSRALNITELRSLTNPMPLAGTYGGQLPSSTALSLSAGATFDLGGNSQSVASLADGSGGGVVTNSGAADATLTLGAASGTTTFSGIIADDPAFGAIHLVKSGGATQVLSGANTCRGALTINAGTLLVNGSTSTGAVTVAGGTLGGTGLVSGLLTMQGGTLSPGLSIGTLTFGASVNLGGTTFLEINRTNAPMADRVVLTSGLLQYGGTLTVTNLGPALESGDTFALFSAPGSAGAFGATNLPALSPGLAWNFDPANGLLSVTPAVATNAPDLAADFSGGTLTLSWPADHIGWRLQAQTNSWNGGLDTNWVAIAGSESTNQVIIPITTTEGRVFFRLIYP